MHVNHASHATLQMWVCTSGFLKNVVVLCGTKAIIGGEKMANNWHANRNFIHYTVVSRHVRKHTQTNTVKDLPRSGRPHATSQREDMALHRLVRRMPFATIPVLKRQWLPNRRLSARTIRKHLKSTGLKSRRVTERPILSDRHQRLRLARCLARRGLNLRIWRRIHWSDESRFLLHVTDGRMRVWRQKNKAYTQGTSSKLSFRL